MKKVYVVIYHDGPVCSEGCWDTYVKDVFLIKRMLKNGLLNKVLKMAIMTLKNIKFIEKKNNETRPTVC